MIFPPKSPHFLWNFFPSGWVKFTLSCSSFSPVALFLLAKPRPPPHFCDVFFSPLTPPFPLRWTTLPLRSYSIRPLAIREEFPLFHMFYICSYPSLRDSVLLMRKSSLLKLHPPFAIIPLSRIPFSNNFFFPLVLCNFSLRSTKPSGGPASFPSVSSATKFPPLVVSTFFSLRHSCLFFPPLNHVSAFATLH